MLITGFPFVRARARSLVEAVGHAEAPFVLVEERVAGEPHFPSRVEDTPRQ